MLSSRRLAAFLACVLSVSVLGMAGPPSATADDKASRGTDQQPSASRAPSWSPATGASFNLPRGGNKQFRSHERFVAAVRHAPKGSTIRISVFSFDRKNIAYDLAKAHKRGVNVQVLLNSHQVTPAQRILHRALGKNRWRRSFAYECTRGCRSSGENLHSKFFLFTKSGKAENVVMTGSLNFTMNSAANQYNDMFTANNSSKLHQAFVNVFAQMRRDKVAKPGWYVQKIGKGYRLSVTPFGRSSVKRDPIMARLNQVKCRGARNGNNGRTIVRVMMHAWNETRGHYLAKKIRAMHAAGCDVRVAYGYAGELVRNTFATRTKRGYVPVHTTGYDTNSDGFIDLYTHQKELLINGVYGKNRAARIVLTGSSNWNTDGLRGDEEFFEIFNRKSVFRQYMKNFGFIWDHRSHQVKYIPYRGRLSARPEPLPLPGGPAWEDG